jgi:CheY-like chemotaxis protein
MTRSAALRSHGGVKQAGSESPPTFPAAPALASLARTIAPVLTGLGTKRAGAASPPAAGSDTTRRRKAEAKEKAEVESALDVVLHEVRALRETQERILRAISELRRASRAPSAAAEGDGVGMDLPDEPAFSPIRDGRRKTVMLIDDDPATRDAAIAELQRAEVPVRAFDDGSAALSAIAEEKPDVIALEIGLGGAMGGKDLVNLIKATMEWVDIPIVLWTREGVSTQKEARQIHGADEVVPKSGGPAALLACVIDAFRR